MAIKYVQQCNCMYSSIETHYNQSVAVIEIKHGNEFKGTEYRTVYKCSICGVHCRPLVEGEII